MKRKIKKILAHCCVACSLAWLILHVLDWYNPFMDFAGQSGIVVNAMAVGAFLLGMSHLGEE